MTTRTVAVLGSTGSIGTQALEVVAAHPDRFTIVALSAGGNVELLARQAVQFDVPLVAAARGEVDEVRAALAAAAAEAGRPASATEVVVGPDAATVAAGCGADVVLNGVTGSIGLRPTLAALAAGSVLALANKESLIIGGSLVKAAAGPDQVVPVDSEHSAIAQSLRGGRATEVRRLVVTASGGPFRGRSRAELADVTPEQALAHPNFAMGRVITTNSATLVNKGLEVIEAHLLFDIPFDRIDVVVHPQQQIHSMVEFHDGSTIAQLGPPRMLVPIALGLSWPERLADVDVPCDWSRAQTWEFHPLDDDAFPAVRLARQVGAAGGTFPAVYNAANEVCVDAFHDGTIRFTDIVDTVGRVVDAHAGHRGRRPEPRGGARGGRVGAGRGRPGGLRGSRSRLNRARRATASRTQITDHEPVWRVVRDLRAAAPCGCGPPHLPGPCYPAVTSMWWCVVDQVPPADAWSVLRGQQPPAAAVCVVLMGMTVPDLGCAPGSGTGAERVQISGPQPVDIPRHADRSRGPSACRGTSTGDGPVRRARADLSAGSWRPPRPRGPTPRGRRCRGRRRTGRSRHRARTSCARRRATGCATSR